MAKAAAILGVHLLDAKLGPVNIGTLTGHCIIKVASDTYRGLPEAEHGAMTLVAKIGVETATC
ncbi:hypothetical protein TomMM35A_33510 [Sphingobium sp. TomMM35A]